MTTFSLVAISRRAGPTRHTVASRGYRHAPMCVAWAGVLQRPLEVDRHLHHLPSHTANSARPPGRDTRGIAPCGRPPASGSHDALHTRVCPPTVSPRRRAFTRAPHGTASPRVAGAPLVTASFGWTGTAVPGPGSHEERALPMSLKPQGQSPNEEGRRGHRALEPVKSQDSRARFPQPRPRTLCQEPGSSEEGAAAWWQVPDLGPSASHPCSDFRWTGIVASRAFWARGP